MLLNKIIRFKFFCKFIKLIFLDCRISKYYYVSSILYASKSVLFLYVLYLLYSRLLLRIKSFYISC